MFLLFLLQIYWLCPIIFQEFSTNKIENLRMRKLSSLLTVVRTVRRRAQPPSGILEEGAVFSDVHSVILNPTTKLPYPEKEVIEHMEKTSQEVLRDKRAKQVVMGYPQDEIAFVIKRKRSPLWYKITVSAIMTKFSSTCVTSILVPKVDSFSLKFQVPLIGSCFSNK